MMVSDIPGFYPHLFKARTGRWKCAPPVTQEVQVTLEVPTKYSAERIKALVHFALNQVASGIDVISIKEEAEIYGNR